MKHFVYFLFLASLLSLIACSSDNDGDPDVLPPAKPIVIKSEFNNKLQNGNQFAFDLFKATYKFEDKENIFISPLSVDMALSMTWNGAEGETKKEMQTALRNEGYTSENINEYNQFLREALTGVDPTTRIAIANSIWSRQEFNVQKNFIDVNKLYYNAEVQSVDFSSPETLTKINNWCANNTNNKIPEIIEEIPNEAMMFLINAIYFKGIWASQFDKKDTSDGQFKAGDGQVQNVKMMSQKSDLPYTEDLNCRYLEMPYGNGAFSMVVVLPQDGKNINDVTHALTNTTWKDAMDRLSECRVNLRLPRFKIECSYRMEQNILPEMGMKQPFQAGVANFSGINPNIDLYISNVIHKTYVEVNEEGTEAAAVTSVGIYTTSTPRPVDFIVDQPFVFAIREKSTGAILFIGKIGVIKQ